MPARMWKYGIHSFLELLRHSLPHSREHMLHFMHLAYCMMTLREFLDASYFGARKLIVCASLRDGISIGGYVDRVFGRFGPLRNGH